MKKVISFFGLLLFMVLQVAAQQRTVAECTINYEVISDSAANQTKTHKTVYIKGNDCRTDIKTESFSQTTFYDKTSGNAVVLREFGNNKIMTKLNKKQWIDQNKNFDSATINLTGDTKNILGYECKKAVLQNKAGSTITVFFATAIIASVKEFEYQLKDVPGLVLEYETEQNGKKIKYTATKISLSPVSINKFDVPTTGYRLLN